MSKIHLFFGNTDLGNAWNQGAGRGRGSQSNAVSIATYAAHFKRTFQVIQYVKCSATIEFPSTTRQVQHMRTVEFTMKSGFARIPVNLRILSIELSG